MEDYLLLSDNQLVVLAKQNDDKAFEVIVSRYSEFIYFKSRSYSINGYDTEDIYQEALYALYKAVFAYDPQRSASFNTYAILCITNVMRSIYANSLRKKRKDQIYNISYDALMSDEFNPFYASVAESPETFVVGNDMFNDLISGIKKILSEKECRILISKLSGKSYQSIAISENTSIKNIYNAIDRAHKKINAEFDKDEYMRECIIMSELIEKKLK